MKMISLLALSLVMAASGLVAVPASAAPSVNAVPACDGSLEEFKKNPDLVAAQLQGEGVKFSHLDDWGGCIRAFVTDAHGHTSMAFYDPDTLTLVDTVGSANGQG